MLASLNSFVSAYDQSDFFGKMIIFGLLFLSILCWIILAHKVWMLRKVSMLSKAFQNAFEHHKASVLGIDLEAFPKPKEQGIPHPFAEILLGLRTKTIEVLNKNRYFLSQSNGSKETVYLTANDFEFLEASTITVVSSQIKRLEKNLHVLSTIVTLAPFLGLLGTVWGILVTFSGLHGGGIATSNAAILGGISTALATTVLGLIVAIPSLISYNYLKSKLHQYASDMDDFLSTLISSLEMQYRKVE